MKKPIALFVGLVVCLLIIASNPGHASAGYNHFWISVLDGDTLTPIEDACGNSS